MEGLQTLCYCTLCCCELRDVSWLELLYFFRSQKKIDLVRVRMYSRAMKCQGIWQFDFASKVGNEALPSALVIAQLKVFISFSSC